MTYEVIKRGYSDSRVFGAVYVRSHTHEIACARRMGRPIERY
mgnify:CR=1 FL=1